MAWHNGAVSKSSRFAYRLDLLDRLGNRFVMGRLDRKYIKMHLICNDRVREQAWSQKFPLMRWMWRNDHTRYEYSSFMNKKGAFKYCGKLVWVQPNGCVRIRTVHELDLFVVFQLVNTNCSDLFIESQFDSLGCPSSKPGICVGTASALDI